jgi:hypothetical protein
MSFSKRIFDNAKRIKRRRNMMKKMTYSGVVFLLAVLIPLTANSAEPREQMVITFNNGTTQTFTLSDIARIEFIKKAVAGGGSNSTGGQQSTGGGAYNQTLEGEKKPDWRISIPSMKATYQYKLKWTGDTFTGSYVGINNQSVFKGRIFSSGGKIWIEYVQTDPTNSSYRAGYKLEQVSPGRYTGTLTDNTGTYGIELNQIR